MNSERIKKLFFIFLGLMGIYLGYSNYNASSSLSGPIISIDVELASKVEIIKGRRNPNAFKFWSRNYSSEFVIVDGIIVNGKSQLLLELKEKDTVKILIREKALSLLENQNSKVEVLGVQSSGQEILSLKEYKYNKGKYQSRVGVFLSILGIFLIIIGIAKMKSKYYYIIIGVIFIIVLLMRIMRIGLYG